MALFPGFKPFRIAVQPDVTISGITAGTGPPLLLLHGFPQTHHIWHLIAPQLTSTYTIIALDLRGYGASSAPPGTLPHHREYAKSTMARDCLAVMASLGHASFYVCAHDRGARVAHKLCVDHPAAVRRAIFLDICPTLAMYGATDQAFATAYFHWFFLLQKAPFPETLIAAQPQVWVEQFMGGRYARLAAFHPEALQVYGEALGRPENVHAMCEDYRASATTDLEEARRDIEEGRGVVCPLRVLWGKHGVVEMCFDALKEWKAVHTTGEVDGENVDSGHYIPEEAPEVVVKHIREFFK